MKKSKIKLVLVASLVAMTTIPALLNLSSCSNDKPAPIPGPTPPKPEPTPSSKTQFYFKSNFDYTGKDFNFSQLGEFYVNDNNEALAILSDPSKYTDQMILWDIVNCFVLTFDESFVDFVQGEITDFSRNNNQVKYKINLTAQLKSGDTNQISWYTTNSKDGEFEYINISANWINLVQKGDAQPYSTYKLPLNDGVLSSISLCKSKFVWLNGK
ncbi:MAG: hypothetical protein PUI87_00900 [Mycoplasmataceae bacterium]|nr:hypothetical protein [Mycoplasmataceae bacterium]